MSKKIYIGHSREFDYRKKLYDPIRHDPKISQDEIILPHETETVQRERNFYANLDLFIAEVSYPATGLGIELAWAHDGGVPIICIARADAHISGSLRAVTDQFHQYHDEQEMLKIIENAIRETIQEVKNHE